MVKYIGLEFSIGHIPCDLQRCLLENLCAGQVIEDLGHATLTRRPTLGKGDVALMLWRSLWMSHGPAVRNGTISP